MSPVQNQIIPVLPLHPSRGCPQQLRRYPNPSSRILVPVYLSVLIFCHSSFCSLSFSHTSLHSRFQDHRLTIVLESFLYLMLLPGPFTPLTKDAEIYNMSGRKWIKFQWNISLADKAIIRKELRIAIYPAIDDHKHTVDESEQFGKNWLPASVTVVPGPFWIFSNCFT